VIEQALAANSVDLAVMGDWEKAKKKQAKKMHKKNRKT
jgi:hypothetical protein